MLRCLLLFLIVPTLCFADVDSLKGTTNTLDCFLLSSEATPGTNSDTLNFGVTTGKALGWNNSNQFYGAELFGVRCSTLVADIEAAGNTIDSIVIRKYSWTSSGNAVFLAIRAPSNWVSGTGNGTASPTNGASMKYKGTGTAWSDETASGTWAGYVTQTDDDWNISSLTDFVALSSDPKATITATTPAYATWNVTDQFTDSFAVGQYDVSVLFADTVHNSTGAHERASFYSSDVTVDSQKTTVLFYHSLHVEPDSSFLRVAVTIPSGSVTDLPVLVNWLTYPANASTRFTVYASDSTTKLYWCLDSLDGHYTRIWVGGSAADWGTSDTLFISTDYNPSYQNCDSVFLLYEPFNTAFQVTRLCDTLTEGDRVARDTTNGGTPYLDVLDEGLTWMFENSNTVETDSGYVQVLCGGFTATYDGATDPQDSTFGFVYRSMDLETWSAEGMIVVSRPAPHAEDTIRMQDPYLLMDGDTLRMVFEDKRINTVIGSYDVIGQMVSVDNGLTWAYRGVVIDTSFWDSDEGNAPSSPVLWKIGNDYFLAGEGKNGHYTDNSGASQNTEAGAIYMAYSQSNFYDWHQMYEADTGPGFEIPAIPYDTGYEYACVPDAHWVEGVDHYLSAHTQAIVGSDTLGWQVTVWTTKENALGGYDCAWSRVDALSQNARFWGDSSATNRALADDPQPILIDGNYWMNVTHRAGANPDSVTTMNLAPVVNWDTTGNPYAVNWWEKEYLGAVGYAHVTNGILHLIPEPYSERSSVGIVTLDSFQTNFAVDIRYRFPYPAHRVYTSFSMGNGVPVAYTDSAGTAATNYEVTNIQDGYYYLFNYGSAQIVPGTQPTADNRTTGTAYSAPTYSATDWNNFSWAMIGNGTADSVYSGFGYTLSNYAKNDSMDADYKRVGIFAGTYLYNLTNGGVEVDRMQVRKAVSGGFSTQASDTLYAEVPAVIGGWSEGGWKRNKTWRGGW